MPPCPGRGQNAASANHMRQGLPLSHGTRLTPDIDAMDSAISTALNGPVSVLTRMRLACTVVSEKGEPLECVKSGTSGRSKVDIVAKRANQQSARLAGR